MNTGHTCKVGVLRPQCGAVLTSGVKDNAVGQRKFKFMGKAGRANGEAVIQFHAKALPHKTHGPQGIAFVSLLQNAFEYFKKTEARYESFVVSSIAGAKKSAFGPLAKYSSQPQESTRFILYPRPEERR